MMNNDLISRSALLKKKTRTTEYDETGCGIHVYVVRAEDVEAAPTVDAEPVRHGRWIQNKSVPDYHSCSDCHVTQKMRKVCGAYLLPKYCPNCGAKMDLEVDE